jgi:endonuclease YncB( thermonuclease family)
MKDVIFHSQSGRLGIMPRLLLVLSLIFGTIPWAASAETPRLAFVQADGTLKIGQRIVRLHGVHIPPSNRICRSNLRPVRCASRAALQLDFRVDRFVTCERVAKLRDGSESAVCRVRDDGDALGPLVDLAAWMLYHGWAVATPGAPFEYLTLERIARAQGRGIWGFQADSITFR